MAQIASKIENKAGRQKHSTRRYLSGKNEEYAFPVNDIGYWGISLNLPDRDTAKVMEKTPVKIYINIDNDLDISFEASLKYMDEKLSPKGKI